MALLRSPLHTCHDVMCFVSSSNRTCFEIIARHHETHESVEWNADGCEGLSRQEPSQPLSAGEADSSEVAHVGTLAQTLWENITCLFAVKTRIASFKNSQPTALSLALRWGKDLSTQAADKPLKSVEILGNFESSFLFSLSLPSGCRHG